MVPDKRIALAEAMFGCVCGEDEGIDIACKIHYRPAFDPERNANHDYQVLEWMRGWENGSRVKNGVKQSLSSFAFHYEVGDYYRAAIKALNL